MITTEKEVMKNRMSFCAKSHLSAINIDL